MQEKVLGFEDGVEADESVCGLCRRPVGAKAPIIVDQVSGLEFRVCAVHYTRLKDLRGFTLKR